MAAYSVSGTLIPDATTPNTGEPAGTLNGQPYWTWGVWFLYWKPGKTNLWRISQELDGDSVAGWTRETDDPTDVIGMYQPFTTEGTAIVAEYVEPEEESSASSDSSLSSASSSSTSSASSGSSSSPSSSSASSSQSTAVIDLPRSCMITVTGTFSFTATVEKPT